MDNCHDFFKSRLGITNDNLSNSLMMTSAQVFESSVTTTKFKFTFNRSTPVTPEFKLFNFFNLSFFH